MRSWHLTIEMGLRVLALSAYHGGSHAAFLNGWRAHSEHEWTLLMLPASQWKWRMRAGHVYLAAEVAERAARGQQWDVIVATNMLNACELVGLLPIGVRHLPLVVYFHENAVCYEYEPADEAADRPYDFHYELVNWTSALAATAIWFNSAFHRDALLAALAARTMRRLPRSPLSRTPAMRSIAQLAAKCDIQPPGIALPGADRSTSTLGWLAAGRDDDDDRALRIVWAHRWEADKAPATMLAAARRLIERHPSLPFRLVIAGQQFARRPRCLISAADDPQLAGRLVHCGFLADRRDYEQALAWADVFVSTARQEFFGISTAEAAAAGAFLLLPHRLAYPERYGHCGAAHFYHDSYCCRRDRPRREAADDEEMIDVVEVEALAEALAGRARVLLDRLARGEPRSAFQAGVDDAAAVRAAGQAVSWSAPGHRASALDRALDDLVSRTRPAMHAS